MALPLKRFMVPLRFLVSNPTLRVRTDSVDETLTLAVTADTDYFITEIRDLVQAMLRTATAGLEYSVTLSDDGFFTVTHLLDLPFAFLFEHADSEDFDSTILGWPPYDTDEGEEQDAPYQAKGLWQPDRAHYRDDGMSGDEPVRLGSRTEAANGHARTFLSEVLKYTRRIQYAKTPENRIKLDAYETSRPYGTLEHFWISQHGDGGPLRICDQVDVPELYREYQPMPGTCWTPTDSSRIRYEVDFDLLRTTALTQSSDASLHFAGNSGSADDSVSIADHPSYDLTTKATWSYWAKRDSAGSLDQYMLSRITGTDNAWAFMFPVGASTELRGYIASGATDSSNFAQTSGLAFPTNGTWKHVCWVYDGALAAASRLKLYVDGQPVSLSITGTIPSSLRASAAGIRIGAGPTAADGLFGPGNMTEVSIWSTARTRAQINAELRDANNRPRRLLNLVRGRFVPPANAVGYWTLQNHTLDRATPGNNGARLGAAYYEKEAP